MSRFHIDSHCCPESQSSFPSFRERRDWYDLPLLSHSNDPKHGISYETQANAMRNALYYAGVLASKATQENRRLGARLAEEGGASSSEIARAGGWATGVMETAYLSNLPRQAVRAIAGHPKDGGLFFLPRAGEVPDTLQRKLFPKIEQWYVRFFKRSGSSERSDIGRPSSTIATTKVSSVTADVEKASMYISTWRLRLSSSSSNASRKTFLQDAVQWRKKYPRHFMWQHSLFSDPEFIEFEERALIASALAATYIPQEIRTTTPRLCDLWDQANQASS